MTTTSENPFSPQEIASEGIKPDEYTEIVRRLGRHPNKAELGMFGVMWSEHCCYKNSRPLLKQFPTTGEACGAVPERILVGPGENAGVVDIGDGLQLAFKIESHNHPSAVEPFQGAATGVGGILRDIFTMGARPIALLNSLRFGDLNDPKTQRLFTGVVAGISHYGNCLVSDETFIWKDQQGVHFDTIGNFVESRLPAGINTLEIEDVNAVTTLSLDPDQHTVTWQRIRRIFKRCTQNLITIRTALGRKLIVTPDHPMLICAEGQWDVAPAQSLKVGDQIPIITALPALNPGENQDAPLDLIAGLNPEDASGKDVYVQLPENWQVTEVVRTALRLIEPSATNRHQYLSTGRLPLSHFLALELLLNVSRSDVSLFRRGKANYMQAVIQPNELFARLIGYFLSEGCVSQNGNTYKIIFTFAHHETEYVEDVIAGLKQLGLRPCVEQRVSTIAVYATSWLLGHFLKNVWQCGTQASNKAFPACIFQWSQNLQREALKGLLRGDGSMTTKTNGNHAKISFGTTSHKLFEQTVILLQSQGVMPYIYQRPAGEGEIEGRKHIRKPLWQLEVSNFAGLKELATVFSQQRNAELAVALNRYNGSKYSFPRFTQSAADIAVVKIKSIECQAVDECDVYDVEVDNTHLFVTSSGIVTHNCVGVPTVGGEVYFDPAYSGNPLVNVMALGLMETSEIVKSGASGLGNPVLYVGSTTGRDGMGGASFASAELTDESMDNRPAVQVGDPFIEKSLIEACLEAFKTGAVVAAQDMGAAGITCSTSEMAAKGGVGIDFDLDKIPARELGMIPYEYLLSESQERMLFVAHKGREQELIDIFHRWGLQAVVAGTVIEEPIVRIWFKGEIAAEIPADALAENTPLYERELLAEPPEYAQKAWTWTSDSLPPCTVAGIEIAGSLQNWNQILLTLLDTPTIASKSWVYRQYDHQVQNNTVLLPGGADAAVIRLRPLEAPQNPKSKIQNPKSGVAATVDCNSRYVYLDPYEGAKAVVAEAARNLSCVGAEPIAVTDNLNFGSPEKPIGYWQLASACRGLSEGCRELGTPVTGGNVSLYNETFDAQGNPQPIYPTPVVGMVGLIPDLTKICGQGWQNVGDVIYLLGLPVQWRSPQPPLKRGAIDIESNIERGAIDIESNVESGAIDIESNIERGAGICTIELGASEYLATIHHTIAGKPPRVDFDLERRVQKACRDGIRAGWVNSAHDSAEGGLTVAMAESCLSGNLGAEINFPISANHDSRFDEVLFGEGGARILVSVSEENQEKWESYLQEHLPESWQKLGTVANSASLEILTADNHKLLQISLEDMNNSYSQAIAKRLAIYTNT